MRIGSAISVTILIPGIADWYAREAGGERCRIMASPTSNSGPSNQSWGKEDIQSATEDIDNLLAELDRKIGMVEHMQDECRKRADQITALSASSSKLK
jgi:hypothetical protein